MFFVDLFSAVYFMFTPAYFIPISHTKRNVAQESLVVRLTLLWRYSWGPSPLTEVKSRYGATSFFYIERWYESYNYWRTSLDECRLGHLHLLLQVIQIAQEWYDNFLFPERKYESRICHWAQIWESFIKALSTPKYRNPSLCDSHTQNFGVISELFCFHFYSRVFDWWLVMMIGSHVVA